MFFALLDQYHRWLGTMMDALGGGPLETPSRIVFAEPLLTLKAYGQGTGPAVLLIPAPIKRAYIWDLAPWASVVQRCLSAGLRVYVNQWESPGVDEEGCGLNDYANHLLLHSTKAVLAETGDRQVVLSGHSLGGTLAAIFAALHPEPVRGLVLLGAPLHFGPDAGPLGQQVALAPPAPLLTRAFGNVPGSFLGAVASLAAPEAFQWARWLDWIGSLSSAQAWYTHLLVERWMLDQMPLPRRLYEEVVELLYREDRFQRGSLEVGERRLGPERLEVPLLNVVYPRCVVAPPESVLPFHHAAGSTDKRMLWYSGDTGVALQHVGMLVGPWAHRHLWPEILRWIQASSRV